MKQYLAIAFMLFSLANVFGQTNEICGVVLDKDDNTAIAGVIVQIKDSSGATKQYTITDDRGNFSIKKNISVDGQVLSFQCMGYKLHTVTLDDIKYPLTVHLESQPTQLRDVIIRAPDIEQRSDTLVYYTSKYATLSDNNIADVLKRLPGIKVEESGEIKYNGEPINKFYIDGADFMDGRYGLATENISPSDVASIEVLENHQPIQVLQGLDFSQQAGLNIKLKEDAKDRWVGILNGSLGFSPLLYDASAFAMRIAGKWQNMESVRINNTGWNPASQSQRHIDANIFSSDYTDELWGDYISIGNQVNSLDEIRTRDNFSILANSSNAWHIGDGKDLKFNVTYEGDKLNNFSAYTTNYFDNDIMPFSEENLITSQAHRLRGQLSMQINRPAFFLKENLYVDADWHNANSSIQGSLSRIQEAKTPRFNVTNDFQLLKRIDNSLLTVSSRNSYTHKPHSLYVSKENDATQDLVSTDFRSSTEVRYGWIINKWNIYARGGIDYNYHDLTNNLTGVDLSYKTNSATRFSIFNAFIAPEASFKSNKWHITVSAPIRYHLYYINNLLQENTLIDNFVALVPYIYAHYRLNAKMEFSGMIKYALTPPKAITYIPNVIMTDYRNLYLPSSTTGYNESSSVTLNFKYRNPISSLFFNLTGLCEWTHSPSLYNQLFDGDFIITSYMPTANDGLKYSITGGISKGLNGGRITIGLDVGYASLLSSAMRQNERYDYAQSAMSVQPNIKGYFTNWFSVNYRLTYNHNRFDIEKDAASCNDVLKQYLTLTFVPNNDWNINLGGEHYYTRFNAESSTHLFLFDASVRWTVSDRVELSVSVMNLLNEREYRYATYGILSETDYMFRIRGRSIMAGIQIRL